MAEKYDYQDYPKQGGIEDYNKYQEKYEREPRFSDKVIFDLVEEAVGGRAEESLRLLDIGCSTGNLLGHLKRRFPRMKLAGGDIAASSVEVCRARADLAGVELDVLDLMKPAGGVQYDFVITNAVTFLFDWAQYETAMRNICAMLAPGGTYIAFEWLHPFIHQDIQIFETTVYMPQGMRISARPYPKVDKVLRGCGFSGVRFQPFELPVEIPMPGYDQEVTTYTVKSADGRNLPFRGALFQPWCHLSARKG